MGQLLDQHVGNAALALAGQVLGQGFIMELAQGIALATAHWAVFGQHVTCLAHLLEDLLQKHRFELLRDIFQFGLTHRSCIAGGVLQRFTVLRNRGNAHGVGP